MKISVFWFRRDLRLEDNTGLSAALSSEHPVLPLFIFDKNILQELPAADPRFNFIYNTLRHLNNKLVTVGSSILCQQGDPLNVWEQIIHKYEIASVFVNKDYEPYARDRDELIKKLLLKNGIKFHAYKDQVIFEENDIVKHNGTPYQVFTPYKNRWLENFEKIDFSPIAESWSDHYFQHVFPFPDLPSLGFVKSEIQVPDFALSIVSNYTALRNFPAAPTSKLGPHLRFGTVSIRQVIKILGSDNSVFLNELIWREFFMQILFHFPHVIDTNFQSRYNGLVWRNNESEFKKWCMGETGYPLVDAGMRELNATGFMHNRVRMVVAGFLCKHLLTDWRWGEAYFAQKLLDYELSSNNGNWQWAAGTGCDAAPYFRIFNPIEQLKKFDKEREYVTTWIPELESSKYPHPIVEHKFARERALFAYNKALSEAIG